MNISDGIDLLIKDSAKAILSSIDIAQKAYKLAAAETFQNIVKRTPKDTGRAKGNWKIGYKEDSDVQLTNWANDESGELRAASFLSEKTEGSPRINIYNNLPYIERLENGWSNQAPTGMIALSFKEFDDILMKHWRRLYNESK